MTLSSIALRNIQRNFKDYFVYFASMILVSLFILHLKHCNIIHKWKAEASKRLAERSSFQCDAYHFRSSVHYIFERILYVNVKEVGLYSLLGIRKDKLVKCSFMKIC